MPGLLLILLSACRWLSPAAPPRPTIAVVVARGVGPARLAGEAAVQGVRLAAEDRYDVVVLDEAAPDVVASTAANPAVAAVIAHTGAASIRRLAGAWASSGLPVLTLAAAEGSALPRMVPNTAELCRCAVPLVEGEHLALAYDGSELGLSGASFFQSTLGERVVDAIGVGATTLGADVGRIAARTPDQVVYVGALQLGGDLVRTWRVLKGEAPVVAVGLSASEFVSAVGSDPGEVLVVSPDRPPLDPAVAEAWRTRFGAAPSGAGRTAYDAARLVAAAMDAASARRAEGEALSRATVVEALRSVSVQQGGITTALSPAGGPTPVLCTGYALQSGALTAVAAGRVDADGTASATPIGGATPAVGLGATESPPSPDAAGAALPQ